MPPYLMGQNTLKTEELPKSQGVGAEGMLPQKHLGVLRCLLAHLKMSN